MGCDIHLFVEKKVKGRWVKQDGFVSDLYQPGDEYFGQARFKSTDQPYSGRNYTVFAALADVRNGSGFAGCDTGDAIKPVAYPKGLPADVSDAVRTLSDDYGCDGHSHSHLTLAELLAYDWDKTMVSRGLVELAAFKKLGPGEAPAEWCGGAFGPKVKIVPSRLAKAYRPLPEEEVYVQYEWRTSIREYCSGFLDHMLPLLSKLAGKNADAVRIVFWFDN